VSSSSALSFVIAAAALTVSGCSTVPSQAPEPSAALRQAACPPRTPLLDDSFGAWVLKANELAAMYDECRAAALAP
jgi:hypothetical protein